MGVQQTLLKGYGGAAFDWGGDRGIVAGGLISSSPWYVQQVRYVNIATTGNTSGFGGMASAEAFYSNGCSNGTRGCWGGSSPGNNSNSQWSKRINYITISGSPSTVSDFGDLRSTKNSCAGVSHKTRGLFCGGQGVYQEPNTGPGWQPNQDINQIDYITIASTGNASDFGTLDQKRRYAGTGQDNTRAIVYGGYGAVTPSPSPVPAHNSIEYLTIMTTGNGTDFGDLTLRMSGIQGASDITRTVMMGGYNQPVGRSNVIQYATTATTGNASDFGDLSRNTAWGNSAGNETRAVMMGGEEPAYTGTMDYVTIQTTGNSSDFGDMSPATAGSASFSGD